MDGDARKGGGGGGGGQEWRVENRALHEVMVMVAMVVDIDE